MKHWKFSKNFACLAELKLGQSLLRLSDKLFYIKRINFIEYNVKERCTVWIQLVRVKAEQYIVLCCAGCVAVAFEWWTKRVTWISLNGFVKRMTLMLSKLLIECCFCLFSCIYALFLCSCCCLFTLTALSQGFYVDYRLRTCNILIIVISNKTRTAEKRAQGKHKTLLYRPKFTMTKAMSEFVSCCTIFATYFIGT